jgi:hypothetical protein
MTDKPKHPDIEMAEEYTAEHVHAMLDKAGAVQADGKGLLSDPPRLMTVAERIARIGEDNAEHIRAARYWRKIAERYGAK